MRSKRESPTKYLKKIPKIMQILQFFIVEINKIKNFG